MKFDDASGRKNVVLTRPKVTYGPDGLSECLPEGLYLILRREFVEIKDEKGY